MNNEQLIRQLIIWGVQWVSSERELHRRDGRPLTYVEWSALDGFFDSTTLDSVTIKWMPRLQNPPFYHELKNMNLQLIPFEDSDAITFRDTILFAEKGVRRDRPPRPLLFHEFGTCQGRGNPRPEDA